MLYVDEKEKKKSIIKNHDHTLLYEKLNLKLKLTYGSFWTLKTTKIVFRKSAEKKNFTSKKVFHLKEIFFSFLKMKFCNHFTFLHSSKYKRLLHSNFKAQTELASHAYIRLYTLLSLRFNEKYNLCLPYVISLDCPF